MTKEEIQALIDKKKEEILVPYEKNEGYDFLRSFIDNNICVKPRDFLEVNMNDFVKCLYFLKMKDSKTFSECSAIMDKFMTTLLELDEDELDYFMNMSITFHNDGELDRVVEFLEEDTVSKSNVMIMKIYPVDVSMKRVVVSLRKVNENHNYALSDFFKLLSKEYYVILELIGFVKARKVMESIKEDLDYIVRMLPFNVRKKDKERQLDAKFKEYLYMKRIFGEFNRISKYVNGVDNDEIKYNRNQQRELNGLNVSVTLLMKALDNDEITNAREIVRTVKDETLKKVILKVIYDHNKRYYDKLEAEFNILSKNTNAEYQVLLLDYGIKSDDNVVRLIRHNSLEDVRSILLSINNIVPSNKNKLRVLVNGNVDSVALVQNYINMRVLSLEYIQENSDIFYQDSWKMNLLRKNVALFNTFGVKASLFKNSIDVLFAKTEVLERGLLTIARYDLIKGIKTTSEYGFLLDEDLSLKIDKYLELGYENNLEDNLFLLNSNNIKRLEMVKAMGVEINDTSEIEKILDGSFFIKDMDLDEYIPSIVPYKDKVDIGGNAEVLVDYKCSSRTYNINGVLISINKVSKLLEEGYDLYDAIFSNSNLSEDEYNSVIEGLSQKKIIKRVDEVSG